MERACLSSRRRFENGVGVIALMWKKSYEETKENIGQEAILYIALVSNLTHTEKSC